MKRTPVGVTGDVFSIFPGYNDKDNWVLDNRLYLAALVIRLFSVVFFCMEFR